MRFARVVSSCHCCNPAADQLVEKGNLDLMQLDYCWPIEQLGEVEELRKYATGLSEQLRTLHRWMYLDLKLKIITNAGGGDSLGCVERLAEYLCEHDHGEMPLSLIRGDNVLAILDDLINQGIKFEHDLEEEALQTTGKNIVAANVEIGAGPLVAALHEGARILVTGCYDMAAPSIAAGITTHDWSWHDYDTLARMAVAANSQSTVVEVGSTGKVSTMKVAGVQHHNELENDCLAHADVCCRIEDEYLKQLEITSPMDAGITGSAPNDCWRLRLVRHAGYKFEAFVASAQRKSEQLAKRLAGDQRNCDIISTHLIEEDCLSLFRVTSTEKLACQQSLHALLNLCSQQPNDFKLLGQVPKTVNNLEAIHCLVPKDQILVSVDTRLANEWR